MADARSLDGGSSERRERMVWRVPPDMAPRRARAVILGPRPMCGEGEEWEREKRWWEWRARDAR